MRRKLHIQEVALWANVLTSLAVLLRYFLSLVSNIGARILKP